MTLRSILASEGLVASILSDDEQAERDLVLLQMKENRSEGKNPFVHEYTGGKFNIRLWTANRLDGEPKTWMEGMFRITSRMRGFGMTFPSRAEAEQELKSTVIPDLKSSGDSHYIVGR